MSGIKDIMHRLLTWLGTRFSSEQSRPNAGRVAPAQSRPLNRALTAAPAQKPAPAVKVRESKLVDVSTEVGGRIEDAGPGKNVLVRNKYRRDDADTQDSLKIIDDSLMIEAAEEDGFDPYNTGKFDRSSNWQRVRK